MVSIISKVINRIKRFDFFRTRCQIVSRGNLRISKDIEGKRNQLNIGVGSVLNGVDIRIRGYDNKIIIGDHCYFGKGCSIWAEGNNISITISDNCTFTHDDQICAQENETSIFVGEDCMFSHHINVRTSDSHFIYDVKTGNRLNYAASVKIGNHVWIAPMSIIMKGVVVGDGSIIGTNSIVTKDVPSNSLAVGMPAHVVKNNVSWSRQKLF